MFNNFMQYEYQPYHKIYIHQQTSHSIYLGDVSSALDMQFIRNQPISVVVTAALGMDQVSYDPNQVKHIIYPLLDAKNQNIHRFFNHFFELIQKQIQIGNILVHCAAGISRSATLVISYFMKKNSWSFKEAVKFVRQKRPIVLPNLGFQRQLKQYEVALQRQNSYTAQFQRRNAIQSSQSKKITISPYKNDLLPNIKNLGQTSWLKSKAFDRQVNIKFQIQQNNSDTTAQRKIQIRPRKSDHQSKTIKKKPLHLGKFGQNGLFVKLQNDYNRVFERTNNLINMNMNNESSSFNDNLLQYNQLITPSSSHNKKLSSLSHRSQRKNYQLKLKRNHSNNKTRKDSNNFQDMNRVIASKLLLNQRKFNTEKNLRIRGLYRLAQLEK